MTQHLNTDERRGALLGLVALVSFSANTLLLRALSLHFPAADGWVGTFMRGLVGILILLAFYQHNQKLQLKRTITQPLLLLRGLIGGGGTVIFYITLHELGAGRAIILTLTYPFFGAILAALFLKESLTIRHTICLLVGLGGLFLFLSSGFSPGKINPYDGLALLGALLSAIVVILMRHLRHTDHPSTIFSAQCLWGIVITLPVTLPKAEVIPLPVWLALAAISTLAVSGQLFLTFSFRYLSVAKGSGIQMLAPPVIAAGGMLFFGETYSLLEAGGAVVTLAATWFLLITPSSGPKPAPDTKPKQSPTQQPVT